MRYFAKPNTWFDAGTEAEKLGDTWLAFDDALMTKRNDAALFRGIRNGQSDEETCPLSEFEIVE